MKDNFTAIAVILDRSGSMETLAKETIINFNKFLAEQKAIKGEAVLTLATFASDYTLVHNFVPLESIPELNEHTYKTGGFTALNDAMGKTIFDLGVKLNSMREEDKPSKVIVLVLTDGEENRSEEYKDLNRIKEMVKHQTEKYNWLFVFGATGIDNFKGASSVGINTRNSMKFAATAAGIGQTYSSISSNTAKYRQSSFSAQEIGEVGFFNLDKTVVSPAVVIPSPVIVVPTPDKK